MDLTKLKKIARGVEIFIIVFIALDILTDFNKSFEEKFDKIASPLILTTIVVLLSLHFYISKKGKKENN
jgi:hypothetical protein